MDIKFSVPMKFVGFEQSETNPHAITSKLRVYYVGETADGRVFTKDFSDKLIKTLPYAPVVAFYDEDTEDFKGHHSHQYMYGFVDGSKEPEYIEDENGDTWAQ